MDAVGAAVIGAVAGAIVSGLISYLLVRMQLDAQIKAQVALATKQALLAADAERKRMLDATRVAVVRDARNVIAHMNAYQSVGPDEAFYRETATGWRTVRARLYQTFGRDDETVMELVSQVDGFLITLKDAVNGDRDAMRRLDRESNQLIDTTTSLLRELDPAGPPGS
jgi:hypothetical protein